MPDSRKKDITRFRINLLLFIFLAISVMFWFQNHLQIYVTQTIFIGGTITIWSSWKLIQSWLSWGVKTSEISLENKILSHHSAREYLILGLFLITILYFSTSSIYLSYEGAREGESEFKVNIYKNGNPYVNTLELTSYNRVNGNPFFFRFQTETLEFRIASPQGFVSEEVEFHPWTSIKIKVPADFERKKYRIIRLVPGIRFFNVLPKHDDTPDITYFLNIIRNGDTTRVKDLRVRTLYLGAEQSDLQNLVSDEKKAAFREKIETNLLKFPDMEEAFRNRFISTWENQLDYLTTEEFKSGDRIVFQIFKKGAVSPVWESSYMVPEDEVISTIFIE